MKLWLLRPVEDLPPDHDKNPWEPWYDKAFGFVVRAETEEEARGFAQRDSGDECGWRREKPTWLLPQWSTCTPLTEEGEAGVVIRDFASA